MGCGIYKEITSSTNERGMIAAIRPAVGFGNTLPIILSINAARQVDGMEWTSCFDSFAFDYVARSKIQGNHLNWFIVEQLPVVPHSAYSHAFGPKTAAEIVKDRLLRLTYTALDTQPFAREMGYEGAPFIWNEAERRHWRARLDALYFHLYGITDEADIRYILLSFPIVERKAAPRTTARISRPN